MDDDAHAGWDFKNAWALGAIYIKSRLIQRLQVECQKKKSALGQSNSKATPKGFEPLRAEPNGFLVHLLSHSDKVSVPGTICLFITSNGLFVPGVGCPVWCAARVSNTRAAPQATKWPSPAACLFPSSGADEPSFLLLFSLFLSLDVLRQPLLSAFLWLSFCWGDGGLMQGLALLSLSWISGRTQSQMRGPQIWRCQQLTPCPSGITFCVKGRSAR